MEKTDNSISKKMDITELLQLMELIATSLITSPYITDFTVHDVNYIRKTNAGTSFIWFVQESGTYLYPVNDKEFLTHLIETMDMYENYWKSDYCLYRYDGDKLFPVFPKVIRGWIESELTKY